MDNRRLSVASPRQSSEKTRLVDKGELAEAFTTDIVGNKPDSLPAPCSSGIKARFGMRAIACAVSVAVVLFIFIVSPYIPTTDCIHMGKMQSMDSSGLRASSDGRIDPTQVFLNIPSTDRLRKYLEYYSSGAHVAGINRTQAEYTDAFFKAHGIDSKIVEYFPWMNYPVDQRVTLFNESTQEIKFAASLKEDVIPGDPLSEDPNNLPAFHGYSADGNVTGQLVYANYGTVDDFEALRKAGISVEGKVVLVRYGYVFRGIKVQAAEMHGARGILIYSDPADDGYGKGAAYPDGPWRAESSIQRGSVMRLQVYPGDPLTPGYASTEDAPRIDPKDAKNINHIPSIPLSYRDAEPLLRSLEGSGKLASDLGSSWVGGLTQRGVEYWTGPSELSVNILNKVEYKKTAIQNVIGRIKGSEDSEHAVIIGNHRDAWCAGASDPSSGSAALMELAYAFGELMKFGWRPRRTIILASWDAEEYGLVGSTEWVEDKIDWLRTNAIAYINVDSAVSGSSFHVESSPVFRKLLHEVTKLVTYPYSKESVYDAWLRESHANASSGDKGEDDDGSGGDSDGDEDDDKGDGSDSKTSKPKKDKPLMRPLGSGSDYTAFMAHAGVSSVSIGFGGSTGAYHSNYDSPKRLTTFIDPEMKLHQAMVRIWGLLTIKLADDPVIGLSPVSYAKEIRRYIRQLEKTSARHLNATAADRLPNKRAGAIVAGKLRHLRSAQRQLLISAHLVEHDRQHLRAIYGEDCQMKSRRRHASCLKLRDSINDRVFGMERHFIDPEGIPGREWFKHILVSPGRWLGYGSQIFPALAEAIEDGDWRRFQALAKSNVETIYEAAWFLREV